MAYQILRQVGVIISERPTVEENDIRHSFDTNLQTYGGNDGGSPCVFPFVYNGQSHSQCIDTSHNELWCATSSSYDVDGRWGNCPGTCPGLSRFNIKQYTLTGDRGEDNAHLYTFYYYKRATDTAIRVMFHANAYIYKQGAFRYWIRFNGHGCNSPGTIDGIFSHWGGGIYDPTHDGTASITGICNNIGAGRIGVEVHVAQLHSTTPDVVTGWNQRSRIIIEEIRYNLDVSAVISGGGSVQRLPEYNIQQYWWWAINDGTDSGHIGSVSVTYNKRSSQSILDIQWHGGLRQYYANYHMSGCSHWYLTFNGAQCSNPGPIGAIVCQIIYHDHTADIHDDSHHTSTFGGHCNLPAGSYNIRLYVQTCPGHSHNDAYTGWDQSNRLVVKEVFPANW